MARRRWGQLLFPVGSGVLAAAAMPGIGAWPLLLVALIPLLRSVRDGHGFRAGFLFGVAFFAIDLRWVLTLYRFTPLIVPGFVLLIAYLAATTGLATLLLRGVQRRSGPLLWAIAAGGLFALVEWLRAFGPLGLTFPSLYLALGSAPTWIQLAAWTGPIGITALLGTANAFSALAWRERTPRWLVGSLASLVVLLAPSLIPWTQDDGAPLRLALVSSAVEQETKLDARTLPALRERYENLGRQALAAEPDVIVFPESILPAYILLDTSSFAMLADLAREGEARVLFGTGHVRDRAIVNSAVLLDKAGSVVAMYDMIRPVPFGEYIPGRAFWERIGFGPLMDSFLTEDLTAGSQPLLLDEFGTPICFESTFTGGSRDLVRAGARVLVTITNDAWFGGRAEQEAHFAFAAFRAVETRRYVAQAANGGVTGAVSPAGRVIGRITGEGTLAVDVRGRSEITPYVRWGDGPIVAWLAAGVVAAAVGCRRRTPSKRGSGIS